MKFLDVRTDFAFKKVFGSNDSKIRLISFLNSIIDFDGRCEIIDLAIVDPYNIPQLKGMKDTFVDVKAVLSDETTVIIEMQVLNHPGFENRVLYNAAKNYSTQLVKGQRYDLLKPVIAVTIVNFNMFNDSDDMINYFKVLNKKDFTDYSDDIELIFIELNKFTKTQAQCNGIQDDWIFFLKNAGELTVIPKNLPEPVVTAYEVSNEAGMSKEELELQYNKQQYIAIQLGALELAEKQGIEQGIEKGIEQGIEKGIEQGKETTSIDIARKMKQQGFDLATIHQITGININKLNNLKE